MADAVVLLGCGDVGPIHEPMDRYSELVPGASRPRRTKHIGVLRATHHDPNGDQHSLPIGGERVDGSLDALGAHQELL